MPATDNLPRTLGPYRLQDRLGEGGMGVVHLARDPEGRAVAVKVLHPLGSEGVNARRRLAREVETMRRVRSPYVAEVLDADVTGDFVYARLMRSRSDISTGYAPADLDAWAARTRLWAEGGIPEDLPTVQETTATKTARDVFVYFISSAKERNPAAAMALSTRL